MSTPARDAVVRCHCNLRKAIRGEDDAVIEAAARKLISAYSDLGLEKARMAGFIELQVRRALLAPLAL
jgi:hypothetical protein